MTMDSAQNEAMEARAKLRRADPRKAFDDTMAELFRTQERMQAVRAQLRDKPTKVTSKDGMVTVVLDDRGEVTSITFNTQKFRKMAPAELGAALVEVLGRARAESRNRLLSAYRPFLPEGMDLGEIMSGKLNMASMLESAKRRGEQILADAQRDLPTANQQTRRG